ncbi:MAG: hypothetical protein OXU20_23410 [Myxococcales bacterium]|nr:hypothetical protein [Myxococcales bacterium]
MWLAYSIALRTLARWVVFVLALSAIGACVGTRTGNPYDDGPDEPVVIPTYESSSRFSPEWALGGQLTETASGGVDAQAPMTWTLEPEGGYGFLPGGHLVVAGGPVLMVWDVDDPKAPSLLGYMEIRGVVVQMQVIGQRALLAAQERTLIDADSPPAKPVPPEQGKLLLVDLADPSAPRRVDEALFEGQVLRFDVRGERVFALSNSARQDHTHCGERTLIELPGQAQVASDLVASAFDLTSNGFNLHDQLPVPADTRFVWASGDAYFALDDFFSTSGGSGKKLSWVDFSSGELVAREPLPQRVRPDVVERQGDLIVVLGNPQLGGGLGVWTLDGAGAGALTAEIPVPEGTTTVGISSDRRYARLGGRTASLVDLSDPAQPRIAAQLPVEVAATFEAPDGLLGVGVSARDGRSELVLTLWDVTDLAAPTELSRLDTGATIESDLRRAGLRLSSEHELLLFAFRPAGQPHLGVANIDSTNFGWHSRQAARSGLVGAFTDGAAAYSLGWQGLEVFPLVEGADEAQPVSALLAPAEVAEIALRWNPWLAQQGRMAGGPLAELTTERFQLTLRQRPLDGRSVVDSVQRDSGETSTLVLPHRAEALLPAGDRVITLGFDRHFGCDLAAGGFEEIPNPGINCAPEQRRGASVLDVAGAQPTIETTVPLNTAADPNLPAGTQSQDYWEGYHDLGDGRAVFFVRRTERCNSHTTCEALGVPAYESVGTSGCSSNQDCSDRPAVQTFVNGSRASMGLYVLDARGGNPATLSQQARLQGRFRFSETLSHDVGWQLLRHGEDFAIAREQDVYGPDGNSILNEQGDSIVRFYLHPVDVSEAGLSAEEAVNIPGRPVAWSGASLLTLEPGYTDSGDPAVTVRRSELRDGGAFIVDHLPLGGGFREARVDGDYLWILRLDGPVCAEGTSTELLSIPVLDDPVAAGEPLRLPGWSWNFEPPSQPTEAEPGSLRLRGGPQADGVLTVDISTPSMPRSQRYVAGVPH